MATNIDFPIVVDLDGTLTPTDTLIESVFRLIRQSPFYLLKLPLWLMLGKAAFKAHVAARIQIAVDLLPYNEPLLTYLAAEKARGRKIILATAAHRNIAEAVAIHLGLFTYVLASDAMHNLKGRDKLEAIRDLVGEHFVYAGDCAADLPIWQASTAAVLVGVPAWLAQKVKVHTPIELEISSNSGGLRVWVKAMRVYQWSKNLLLAVPLFTAFSFTNLQNVTHTAIAFLAFSLTASATYMGNDLWDLESDRAHPRKCKRPFASACLSIPQGLMVAILLLVVGFGLAMTVSSSFCLMLAGYLILTTTYSLVLKTHAIIDVLILALLYTLRILAGSAAIAVSTTSWLLAVSLFTFLSLALVKRCTELLVLQNQGGMQTKGRDYSVQDLAILWPLGVGSALSAVVVFGLFISASETQTRYATPALLWVTDIALIYWLARLWVKTARGHMHDDPLIYAVKDPISLVTVLFMVAFMVISHFFRFNLFF